MKNLILIALFFSWGLNAATIIYVAKNGNDACSGRLSEPKKDKKDGPLATLEAAREKVRQIQGSKEFKGRIIVAIRRGIYECKSPLILEEKDSGTAENPIIYRAYNKEKVELTGARRLRKWTKVSNKHILRRLPSKARNKVLAADLKEAGIKDCGTVGHRSWEWGSFDVQGLELFCNAKRLTLARYPNKGSFMRILNRKGERGVAFSDERATRWKDEKDLWTFGYWGNDWAQQFHKVDSLDIAKKVFNLGKPTHPYGYRKGQRFYIFNALAELDQPGEYFVDRDTMKIYLWPPKTFAKSGVSATAIDHIISLNNVSHVVFQDLAFTGSRGSMIEIKDGTNVKIIACTLRASGMRAIKINGGSKHMVYGCDIYEIGSTGIDISAGDRKTLTPAGHLIENCHIHHFSQTISTYAPAVNLDQGVGQVVRNNLIHDSPHTAILFMHGNDHLIEYNEIHSVCYETRDCGAIYTGRDWTTHGNCVRFNFIHHIMGPEKEEQYGIYLDDAASGIELYGNILYKCATGMEIGGGRWNRIENNVFSQCNRGIVYDGRGLRDRWKSLPGKLQKFMEKVPITSEVWKRKYPMIALTMQENYRAPQHSTVRFNISYGGKWDFITHRARPHLKIEGNLIDDKSKTKISTKKGATIAIPAKAKKLGFKAIPFSKIGLYKDSRRGSWPVESQVNKKIVDLCK